MTDLIVGDGDKDRVDIVIDDDLVTATDQHPFWVDDQGRWVDAEDLRSGDLLLLADGSTTKVDQVSERSAVQRVHNLSVDGIHTYLVVAGEDEVIVHNCLPTRLHLGKQGKRIPGHNNYREGYSPFTHSDPQGLLDQFGGKGNPVRGVKGQAGYRERVDFGVVIGEVNGVPTTKGIIHYAKNDVHIVPANP